MSLAGTVAQGSPMVVALPRKISENDWPTHASIPHRLSACGACSRDEPRAEVLVDEQDGRARVGGVRERMSRHRAAVVPEHVRAETVEGQRLQEPRGDDPIRVDVVAAERDGGPLDAIDGLELDHSIVLTSVTSPLTAAAATMAGLIRSGGPWGFPAVP